MQAHDPQVHGFSTFLELERMARHAESVAGLAFVAVNDTRRLLGYRQALLVAGGPGSSPRLEAVSGVSVLERDAPFVRWHEAAAAALLKRDDAREVRRPTGDDLPERLRAGLNEWHPGYVLWVPLIAPDGEMLGALWLSREPAWSDSDAVLAERLADCYAHAWRALVGRKAGRRQRLRPRLLAGGAALVLLASLALPVSQSALAPAEVVAAEPRVVAAPIDGVIAEIHTQPNARVEAGQALFSFDDTTLRGEADVARRALAIATAELRQASQGAFTDRLESAKLSVLETKRDLRAAELERAQELLARVTVTAQRPGVAIFTDPNDWIGRPVRTGERVMQIADPSNTRLRIDLPVQDAIELRAGAKVALFLDVAPLKRIPARLESASYEAEPTSQDVLAYRVYAEFVDDGPTAGAEPNRIGLKGTAKVFGDSVPLALYLFRRPLAAARQWLGL